MKQPVSGGISATGIVGTRLSRSGNCRTVHIVRGEWIGSILWGCKSRMVVIPIKDRCSGGNI